MKHIYIFLLIIFAAVSTFGETLHLAYNELERLEALEKDNKYLLSRIEIVEHTLAKLEKNLNAIKQRPLALGDSSLNKASGSDPYDIFDIAIEESNKDANKNSAANSSLSNIPNDKQLYDLALASLKDNKLAEAEKKFAEFIKIYSSSPLSSNAYFWYGESFLKRNMFDKAAINYLKGYKHAPKGPKASDSLLKLALALGSLNKLQEACSIINKLEAEFPTRASTSLTRAKEAKIKFGCKK